MADQTRVSVNLSQGSFEVEGSEGFVRSYADRIELLLGQLSGGSPSAPADAPSTPSTERSDLGAFGAYIQAMDDDATDVERMLAAGYWIEARSNDSCFGTGEASKLLLEQGHKVGNPSQSVKQSLTAKNLFVLQKGRYRVSKSGRDRLRLLMGEIIPI